MIYLISRNHYLNYGIKLLFNSAGLDVTDMNFLHEDWIIPFTENDIILIDASERIPEPVIRIMKCHGHPKIIAMSRDGNNKSPSLSCIYSYLDIHAPVKDVLGNILETLHTVTCLPAPPVVISDKQHYIINESLKGKSVRHIASELGGSAKTIYSQRYYVCRKFGVKNLKELNRFAGFFTVK
ncbi:helix-turn-helix transcriptional regulator [Rahnella victoriana]|uniref:helix-turn-helix transcriptional regulator n=1 Tax=Rahnella victoriana TaxID=1510570 RepID=UPI0013F157DA|nr:LuxR C-terminal-related transcriptional regulator [Rahnella victoriana]